VDWWLWLSDFSTVIADASHATRIKAMENYNDDMYVLESNETLEDIARDVAADLGLDMEDILKGLEG